MGSRIVNMDDPHIRLDMINRLRDMRGRWRFDVVRYRPRRSDRQHRFMWPYIVEPFGRLLREAGNEYTNEDAHELLKHKFLRGEWINEKTGEVCTYTRSTTKLDTAEFNDYLDRCAAWLAELGVEVPDPSDYHERDKPES